MQYNAITYDQIVLIVLSKTESKVLSMFNFTIWEIRQMKN